MAIEESILGSSDQVTPNGDVLFRGDCNDVIIVHTKPIEEATYQGLRIIRAATKQEFMDRCPQVPKLSGLDHYFFYLARRA